MTAVEIRCVPDRRAQIRAEATALGIDERYISVLVEQFYGQIRQHETLGPIFGRSVADWGPHLERMKTFWSSVALNSGRYTGKPVPAHMLLKEVTPDHFDQWLALFEDTLARTAPSPGAVPYFMERARRIAESLKLSMFGVPELQRRQGAIQ